MCRSCKSDAPKWGHGIKVPVSDLPRFFESQQSWNFEQKIYGRNVEVLENVRPTLTGRLGCRDTSTSRRENQFLVREIFHCPGWRYGCTPRIGCSGKRKNCYALCKVAIYSDNPDVGIVQYAGSHGAGNPTNPMRHRPTNRVRQFIRQQHLLSGATPAQLEYAIRRAAIQEGKDTNDPRHVPTSAMIRHIVKRARTGPSENRCKNALPQSKEDVLDSLSRVADIVRPIAIKADPMSPRKMDVASISPMSLPSPDSLKDILPIQLAGLADLILRNQLNVKSMWSGSPALPLLYTSSICRDTALPTPPPDDELGSVGSLSPSTPPSPHSSTSSTTWSAHKPAIWRPYLTS